MKITRTEAGTFFVAAIAVSAAIWRLAFNLGAYQTVFAEHLMVVWIVSIAAIIASVFIGELEEGEPYLPYWGDCDPAVTVTLGAVGVLFLRR